MRLIDPKDPFFAKTWVRWATVLAPAAWGVVELALGNPGWAAVFLLAGAYAGWVLILNR